MLRFEMTDVAADLNARTIEGVVVPFDEVGRIAGVEYRFRPGSIAAARPRTPLLLDHDRGQPVGVLAELVDDPRGAIGRFKIDQTPAGDMALVQASSGSRGALSVGAEVVASSDVGGVIDVTAGLLHEVSLLALGAFPSATVTRVAAEADDPDDDDGEPHDPLDDENDDVNDDDDEPPEQTELELVDPLPAVAEQDNNEPGEGSTMEATETAPVIIAAGADRSKRPELLAGELVALIVRAQHGEPDARRYLEAALVESISTDVSGLLPPTFERSVLGGKIVPRPLYNTFRGRALPGVGLAVNKPKWTTPPDGQWAATVDDDAHSTKVVVGAQSADVERWDWAGAIPWVVVQRSDPSIVDAIYGEAVLDFYLDVETKIATELAAATAGTSTTLGAGIAEFFGIAHRSPDVIIVAPDVWGALADAGALTVSLGQSGVSASGDLTSVFAGISIVSSGSIPAGSGIVATNRAVDARVTDPVRLTANAIGALNVELAVVGEGLFDTDHPNELLKLSAVTPPVALSSGRSSK